MSWFLQQLANIGRTTAFKAMNDESAIDFEFEIAASCENSHGTMALPFESGNFGDDFQPPCGRADNFVQPGRIGGCGKFKPIWGLHWHPAISRNVAFTARFCGIPRSISQHLHQRYVIDSPLPETLILGIQMGIQTLFIVLQDAKTHLSAAVSVVNCYK